MLPKAASGVRSFDGEAARLFHSADQLLDELLVRLVRREHEAIEAETMQMSHALISRRERALNTARHITNDSAHGIAYYIWA